MRLSNTIAQSPKTTVGGIDKFKLNKAFKLTRLMYRKENRILLAYLHSAGKIIPDQAECLLGKDQPETSLILNKLVKAGVLIKEREGKTFTFYLNRQKYRAVAHAVKEFDKSDY